MSSGEVRLLSVSACNMRVRSSASLDVKEDRKEDGAYEVLYGDLPYRAAAGGIRKGRLRRILRLVVREWGVIASGSRRETIAFLGAVHVC